MSTAPRLSEHLPQTITTTRLILRLYEPDNSSHGQCMLSCFHNPKAPEMMGEIDIHTIAELNGISRKLSVQPSRIHLRSASGHDLPSPEIDVITTYIVYRLEDSTDAIGGITLGQRSASVAPDLGWCMLERAMGMGYATEAARVALQVFREDLRMAEIMCFPNARHEASAKVARKIGFVYGGTARETDGREHAVYVLPGMGWRDGTVVDLMGEP